MGDEERAEALVIAAIESLDPENVSAETLRNGLVDVLVRAQIIPKWSNVSTQGTVDC